jgi:hypothetical protein
MQASTVRAIPYWRCRTCLERRALSALKSAQVTGL